MTIKKANFKVHKMAMGENKEMKNRGKNDKSAYFRDF